MSENSFWGVGEKYSQADPIHLADPLQSLELVSKSQSHWDPLKVLRSESTATSRDSVVSLGQSAYLSGGGGGELQGSLRPKTLSNPKMVWLWDLTLEKGK